MKNNLTLLTSLSLFVFVMPVRADIYFENLTNQNVNVKFKVCIEKSEADAKNKDKNKDKDKETKEKNKDKDKDKDKSKEEDQACKKYQDFEAGIAAGYRAKTSFDNIIVTEVNIKTDDKYGDNVLEGKNTTCTAEYKDKDKVLRLWLKDVKAAKQIVTCKAFEDKPAAEKTDSEKK